MVRVEAVPELHTIMLAHEALRADHLRSPVVPLSGMLVFPEHRAAHD